MLSSIIYRELCLFSDKLYVTYPLSGFLELSSAGSSVGRAGDS